MVGVEAYKAGIEAFDEFTTLPWSLFQKLGTTAQLAGRDPAFSKTAEILLKSVEFVAARAGSITFLEVRYILVQVVPRTYLSQGEVALKGATRP